MSKSAGGFGLCKDGDEPASVLGSTDEHDYKTLLAMVEAGKAYLEEIKRFDMPDFKPRPAYVREMQRYGVLGPEPAPKCKDRPLRSRSGLLAITLAQPRQSITSRP
ncbi:MAG: hypothetical protein ISS79_08600 [Phycisphaerae bacterium]|nr:hypothetical protein [Phycisphaerae bacterium]